MEPQQIFTIRSHICFFSFFQQEQPAKNGEDVGGERIPQFVAHACLQHAVPKATAPAHASCAHGIHRQKWCVAVCCSVL